MRRTSTTASLAAGIRAHHWQWNLAPIFADEYAVDMVSLGWRLIVKNRLLNWLVVDKLLAPFRPIHTATPRTFSASATPKTVSTRP